MVFEIIHAEDSPSVDEQTNISRILTGYFFLKFTNRTSLCIEKGLLFLKKIDS